MPFRSEKQRRFLWAAHPDIAKRWAHEYPTKKKLPMYASDEKKPEKADTNSKQSAVNSVALNIYRKLSKQADTKEVYITQPHSDKPTMAGENPPQVTKAKSERCNSETKPNYGVNKLMAKLSAVLSQPIMQALENERAELEAREAAMQPANVGIKRYAMPAAGTPLPMGMQAPAPQGQAQAPAAQPANMGSPAPSGQLPPVGGGSSPNANPINSYGGISSSGDINGNAAFGTAKSMGGEKLAAGLFSALGRAAGKAVSGIAKKAPTAAATAFKMPVKPTTQDLLAYGKQIGIGDKMPRYTHQEFANYQLMKQRINTQPAAARPAAPNAAAPRPAPAPKPATAVAQPQQRVAPPVPAPTPAPTPAPVRPVAAPQRPAPITDDLSLDDDLIASFGKSSGSSPAWQRSAGKNPEGEEKLAANPGAAIWRFLRPHVDPSNSINIAQLQQAAQRNAWQPKGLVNTLPATPPGQPALSVHPYSQWLRTLKPKPTGENFPKPPLPIPNMLVGASEKASASSPAWQRSAGKNPEGGLNEKGRKSYERETGGNLKAPVTESKPTGERAKRQNSFCSRMCGMKRVNTGAKTKSDPDSRINKSLRKWNCKCSSAYEFGTKLASALIAK